MFKTRVAVVKYFRCCRPPSTHKEGLNDSPLPFSYNTMTQNYPSSKFMGFAPGYKTPQISLFSQVHFGKGALATHGPLSTSPPNTSTSTHRDLFSCSNRLLVSLMNSCRNSVRSINTSKLVGQIVASPLTPIRHFSMTTPRSKEPRRFAPLGKNGNKAAEELPVLRGVVFDVDGTLW